MSVRGTSLHGHGRERNDVRIWLSMSRAEGLGWVDARGAARLSGVCQKLLACGLGFSLPVARLQDGEGDGDGDVAIQ